MQSGGDRCQSCGERDPEWKPKYPGLAIFRCAACDSLSFRPGADWDTANLYGRSYFEGGEYKDYQGHRRIHELNFERKWRILERHLPSPQRIFEIGCAHGYFLDFAKRKGAERIFGVDVSKDAVEFAEREFGPGVASTDENTVPDFRYNCLVAWDTWEHLQGPLDLMARLVPNLERGGILAITTVDSSSVVARLRGRRWRQIHPPTHVHYPRWNALARAISGLGLEVVHHGYFGYHRSLETYLAPFGLDRIPFLPSRAKLFPILLDLRDTQMLIARKP